MAIRSTALAHAVALLSCLIVRDATASPWPNPVASYTIEVVYDASTHTLTGRETIAWRNTAKQPARELRFHLYQNAFANSLSSFFRESDGEWEEWAEEHDDPWGYTEVASIRVGGEERVGEAEFVQPDDSNLDDRTVLAVPLAQPVAAGAAIEIAVEFTTKLPRVFARSGYAGTFAMVAQWFPKLGVFGDGGWNCHQYHYTTEFFSDFGTYRVSIDVPADAVVGATGNLEREAPSGDQRKRLEFTAEGVHDFALAIDPRFDVIEREIEGVTVRLLIQPLHAAQASRYLDALAAAMRLHREWIAPYPYATLTLIDPGPGGLEAGGMEYPTLITLGTAWWMPSRLRLPEVVTIHEFGHQYWYGIVANDEAEDAWLDEGINLYLEGRIMDAVYGAGSYADLFGLRIDRVAEMRAAYLRAASKDPIAQAAWQFFDRRSYSAISYAKAALALETLARQYGEEKIGAALRDYFEKWKFRHPRESDFLNALELTIGEDLGTFIEQVINGTAVADFAVTRVESTEVQPLTGYEFDRTRAGKLEPSEHEENQPRYRSEVVVERLGEIKLPVEVEVIFDDGSTARELWDGQRRWRKLEYIGTQQVDWAVIDPDVRVPLDINRLNNSRMRRAGTRGIVRLTSRWGFWFQSALHLLAGL